jgi:hypothetical protein
VLNPSYLLLRKQHHVRLMKCERCYVPRPHFLSIVVFFCLFSHMSDNLASWWLVLDWDFTRANIFFNSKGFHRIPISHLFNVSFVLQEKEKRKKKTEDIVGQVAGGLISLKFCSLSPTYEMGSLAQHCNSLTIT